MSQTDNTLDFRRFFRCARRLWWLYAAAFIVLMGGAITYSLVRMPAYDTTATMLIEDSSDQTPGGAGMAAALLGRSFSIGGFGSSSVSNEVYVVDSHDVLMATAKALGLNRIYIARDGLRKELLYPVAPVRVDAPQEYFDTLTSGYVIKIKISSDGKADIDFKRGRIFKKTILEAKNVSFPYVSTDPEIPVTISATSEMESGKEYNLQVFVDSYESAAEMITSEVTTEEPDKLADAIRLTFTGPNKDFNKGLLDGLLEQYNKMRVERRRETAKREIEFLNERIARQITDLDASEKKMESYMTANNLTSIEEEVKLLVEKSLVNEQTLRDLQTSVKYYNEVLHALRDKSRPYELIPSGPAGTPMIAQYNSMILERKNLLQSATHDNTALRHLESSIDALKETIEKSTENLLTERSLSIKAIKSDENATNGRLSRMPAHEREFFNLTRDKEIQNQLYLFLIEKRENALLKYDSNSTLGFVIEKAYCSVKPSKKKSIIACALALVMSFVLPSCLVIFIILWRQKVEGKMDLNFGGLERRTAILPTSDLRKGMKDIRRIIESQPGCREIEFMNLTSFKELPDMLAASFRNVERPAEVIRSQGKDNDEILSASFRTRTAAAISSGTLPVVTVPDPSGISELANIFTSGSVVLVVAVEEGTVDRSYFKGLISRSIPAGAIVTAIVVPDGSDARRHRL